MKNVKKFFLPHEINQVIDETGVYAISFGKGRKFYIGSAAGTSSKAKSGRGFYSRWRKHLIFLRKGSHYSPKLQNAYNKYSENNMKFHILKICKPSTCLKNEQIYIDKYKSFDNGYNCRPIASNNGGLKWSLKRKLDYTEKYRILRLKYIPEITKLYNQGYSTRDISIKLKISRTFIQRIFKENNILSKTVGQTRRKPINQYDLNKNLIKQWSSILECYRTLKLNKNSIRLVLNGTCKQTNGFYFEYV